MKTLKALIPILLLCIMAVTSGCTALGWNTVPVEKLKLKYADAESEIIEIDEMKIHYKDEGQGPVLILLHGVCASLHTWDGWTQRLKDRYRIIRLDIPGFGLTGPAPDKSLYRKDEAVRLFEKVVDEMKLEKAPTKKAAAVDAPEEKVKQADNKLISKLMERKDILEARHPITGEPLPEPLHK